LPVRNGINELKFKGNARAE